MSVVHIKSAVNIQIINIQKNNIQKWSIAILIVPSRGIFLDQKIPFLKITLLLNSPEKNSKSYLKYIAQFLTQFIFNNEIYNQIDRVSMGSPLAPILANLFIGYHEKDWIEKTQVAKLTFY